MKSSLKPLFCTYILCTFICMQLSASRILCLHGGGGSAASLQYQSGMQDLIETLPDCEFIFASSPVSGGVWYNDPPGGGKDPTYDPNWADVSVNYLNDFIEANGPFDAILGYSQGVPMSLVYLARGSYDFDNVLLFNGYLPTTHMGLMSEIDANSPYTQSALIFIAQNDYNFYEIGLEVKSKFANYTELISTSAGHALPTQSDANFQSVVNFLDNLDSSGSDTSDDGNDSLDNLQTYRLNILQGDDLNNLQIIDTRIIESSSQNQFFKAELIPE
jgi:pimeloyl-ACP methyl ester carboxylesterase